MDGPTITAQYTTQEKLLLAQAVHKLGAVQWPDISTLLVQHPCCAGRPGELFSPEACEAAYVSLMAEAGMNVPAEDGAKPAAKTHLHLAQTFYFARMAELKKAIADSEAVFVTLVDEIQRIKAGELDEAIAKELREALVGKYGRQVVDAWVPSEGEAKAALQVEQQLVQAKADAIGGDKGDAKGQQQQAEQPAGAGEAQGKKDAPVDGPGHGDALPLPAANGNDAKVPDGTDVDTAPEAVPATPSRPVSARDKRASRRDTAEPATADPSKDIEATASAPADELSAAIAPVEEPERPSSRNTRRTARGDPAATPSTSVPPSAGAGARKGTRNRDAQGEADTKEEEERLVEASILPAADSPTEPKEPEGDKAAVPEDVNAGKNVEAEADERGKQEAAETEGEETAETADAEDKEERPVLKTRKSARRESKTADGGEEEGEAVQDAATFGEGAAEQSEKTAIADAETVDKPSRPSRRTGRPSDPAPATPITAAAPAALAEEPAAPPKKKMGRPRKYPRPEDIVVERIEEQADGQNKDKDTGKDGADKEKEDVDIDEPQTATSGIEITVDPPSKKRGRQSHKASAEAKEAKASAVDDSKADDAGEEGEDEPEVEQQEDAPRSARSRPDRRTKPQAESSDTGRPSRSGQAGTRGSAPEIDESRLSPTKPSSRSTGRTLTRSPVKASIGISASPASPLSDLSELDTPGDDEEADTGTSKPKAAAAAAPKRRGRPPRKSQVEEQDDDKAGAEGEADVKEEGDGEENAEEPPEAAASTRSSKRKAGRPPAGAPSAKSKRTSRTGGRVRNKKSMAESEDEVSDEDEDELDEEEDDGEEASEAAEERESSKGKAKATAKSARGRKRKTREESEEQAEEDEAEDDEEEGDETIDNEEDEDDEDEDDGTETEPEPSTTRRGTRRSLPSSSLNPASASATTSRGRRRDSAIAKAGTRESPAVTSPAASTSRRGGSVMSSSYRESANPREKEKEPVEEPTKARRGRPPKKREPSAEPVKETPAKANKRAKQEDKDKDKDKEQEDDRPSTAGTAGRSSRRTKGLPVDEGEEEGEDEKEKERDKEARDKRGKRNSLRMSSARRDTDEPSPGPSTSRRASGSGHHAFGNGSNSHRNGRAGSISSMTPGPDDFGGTASASGSRPTTATGLTPRGVNKEHIAHIIAQAQQGEDDRPTLRERDMSKEGKAMRSMLLGLLENIAAHRNGSVFEKPVRKTDATDYFDIVKRPMDLKTVRARIKDGRIANLEEFTRDVQLIFANAMIYNKKGDQMYDMAVEMLEEAESKIVHFETMQQDLARRRG